MYDSITKRIQCTAGNRTKYFERFFVIQSTKIAVGFNRFKNYR